MIVTVPGQEGQAEQDWEGAAVALPVLVLLRAKETEGVPVREPVEAGLVLVREGIEVALPSRPVLKAPVVRGGTELVSKSEARMLRPLLMTLMKLLCGAAGIAVT